MRVSDEESPASGRRDWWFRRISASVDAQERRATNKRRAAAQAPFAARAALAVQAGRLVHVPWHSIALPGHPSTDRLLPGIRNASLETPWGEATAAQDEWGRTFTWADDHPPVVVTAAREAKEVFRVAIAGQEWIARRPLLLWPRSVRVVARHSHAVRRSNASLVVRRLSYGTYAVLDPKAGPRAIVKKHGREDHLFVDPAMDVTHAALCLLLVAHGLTMAQPLHVMVAADGVGALMELMAAF